MKILHVLDHSIPLHSGYTFRTRSILREQRKLGWETSHITGEKHNQVAGQTPLKETIDGLDFYRTPVYSTFLRRVPILNQLVVIKGLKSRLNSVIPLEKPDVLHAHSPALNGVAAVLAGKKWRIPVVYEIRAFWEDAAVDHGTTTEGSWRYRLTKAMETWVIKRCDAITTICEGLRGDIVSRGIAPEKITVIPNAVNIEQFEPIHSKNIDLLKQYDLEEKFVVGFIGSFYAYEGLKLIIEAAIQLKDKIENLHVLFVGGGPEETVLEKMVKEHGLGSMVTFTGRVPHENVGDYYSLIDVLLYPRLSMRLTELVTPLKPLEAMAQKKLFIASDVGGHKELVEHKKNGILFEADDATDLAAQIVELKSDDLLQAELKENGRKFVSDIRNWKNSVANYRELYNRLIK